MDGRAAFASSLALTEHCREGQHSSEEDENGWMSEKPAGGDLEPGRLFPPVTEYSSPLSSSPAGPQKVAPAAPDGPLTGSPASSDDNQTPVFARHLPCLLGEF